jgi:glucose/mannose-6-phosphate isomerase
MLNLDDLSQIKKYDESNLLGSIDALAQQVEHAWQATRSLQFTPTAPIHNIVVSGMGGSGLGSDIIKNVFKDEFTVPFDFVHDYTLPGYVNQNTLVILASYSGSTEETLASGQQALTKGAQIMVLAAGGPLLAFAQEHHLTAYKIEPTNNPSNQPRMALGYAVFGTIALIEKAGLLHLNDTDIATTMAAITTVKESNTQTVPIAQNPAKQMAQTILGKRPILVGGAHLEGPLHASANQFNENAKMLTDYKIIPEINHHLMEGLKYPASNADSHLFIFVESDLYSPRLQERFHLTEQVVSQNKIATLTHRLTSSTKLAQAFESIAFFAYVNFYVSMLEEINPAPIPFVDWFKEQLSKS